MAAIRVRRGPRWSSQAWVLPSSWTRRPDGGTPVIPMDESGQAPGLQSCAQAADLAHRSSQEFGGLGHQQFATVEGMEDFQTLFGTVRQGNHASPGSTQAGEDIFADPLGRT